VPQGILDSLSKISLTDTPSAMALDVAENFDEFYFTEEENAAATASNSNSNNSSSSNSSNSIEEEEEDEIFGSRLKNTFLGGGEFFTGMPDFDTITPNMYRKFSDNEILWITLIAQETTSMGIRYELLKIINVYWITRLNDLNDLFIMFSSENSLENKMLLNYVNCIESIMNNVIKRLVMDEIPNDVAPPVAAGIAAMAPGLAGNFYEEVFVDESQENPVVVNRDNETKMNDDDGNIGLSNFKNFDNYGSSPNWVGDMDSYGGGMVGGEIRAACDGGPFIEYLGDGAAEYYRDDIVSGLANVDNRILFVAFLAASLAKTKDELSHDFLPYLKGMVHTLVANNYDPVIQVFFNNLNPDPVANPDAQKIKEFIRELISKTVVADGEWNYYTSVLKFIDEKCSKINSVNIVMIANTQKYPYLSGLPSNGYLWQFSGAGDDDEEGDSLYLYKELDGNIIKVDEGKFSDASLIFCPDNATAARKLIPTRKQQNNTANGNVSVTVPGKEGINVVSNVCITNFKDSNFPLRFGAGLLDPANQNPIPKIKFSGLDANDEIAKIVIVPPGVKGLDGAPIQMDDIGRFRALIAQIQAEQDINLQNSRYARVFMTSGINNFMAMFGIQDGFISFVEPPVAAAAAGGGFNPAAMNISFTEEGDKYTGIRFNLTASATGAAAVDITLMTGKGKYVKSDTTIDNVSDFILYIQNAGIYITGVDIGICPVDIFGVQWASWVRLHKFAKAIYDRIPEAIRIQIGAQMGNVIQNVVAQRMIIQIIITLKSFGDSFQIDYVKDLSEYLKTNYNLIISIRSTDKNVGGESILKSCPFWLIGTGIRPHYDYYMKYISFFGKDEFKASLPLPQTSPVFAAKKAAADAAGLSIKPITNGLKSNCIEYNPIQTITTNNSLASPETIIEEVISVLISINSLYPAPPAPPAPGGMEVAEVAPLAAADQVIPHEQQQVFEGLLLVTLNLRILTPIATQTIFTTIASSGIIIEYPEIRQMQVQLQPVAFQNPDIDPNMVLGGKKIKNKIQVGGKPLEEVTMKHLSELLNMLITIRNITSVIQDDVQFSIFEKINNISTILKVKQKFLVSTFAVYDVSKKQGQLETVINNVKAAAIAAAPFPPEYSQFASKYLIPPINQRMEGLKTEYTRKLSESADEINQIVKDAAKVVEIKGERQGSGRAAAAAAVQRLEDIKRDDITAGVNSKTAITERFKETLENIKTSYHDFLEVLSFRDRPPTKAQQQQRANKEKLIAELEQKIITENAKNADLIASKVAEKMEKDNPVKQRAYILNLYEKGCQWFESQTQLFKTTLGMNIIHKTEVISLANPNLSIGGKNNYKPKRKTKKHYRKQYNTKKKHARRFIKKTKLNKRKVSRQSRSKN